MDKVRMTQCKVWIQLINMQAPPPHLHKAARLPDQTCSLSA